MAYQGYLLGRPAPVAQIDRLLAGEPLVPANTN
jgi:EAL domain-containing protein (putative c-di-GMP-specific phosphodiesterase class I)